jgi:hypothetical protein
LLSLERDLVLFDESWRWLFGAFGLTGTAAFPAPSDESNHTRRELKGSSWHTVIARPYARVPRAVGSGSVDLALDIDLASLG